MIKPNNQKQTKEVIEKFQQVSLNPEDQTLPDPLREPEEYSLSVALNTLKELNNKPKKVLHLVNVKKLKSIKDVEKLVEKVKNN